MKILFKFPTRGRPEKFFSALDSIENFIHDKENYHVLVTADHDDLSMNNEEVMNKLADYNNVSICYGTSKSKIDAINRDLDFQSFSWEDWDIICCHSDDMYWKFSGFDTVIRMQFADGNFDKLIHIPDSDAKNILATYYIAGRTYFDRFGFIYNPEYRSLFADNEVQDIAQRLGKYHYVDCPGMLFHANGAYGHQEKDAMFIEQQEIGWTIDQATYNARRARNFDL